MGYLNDTTALLELAAFAAATIFSRLVVKRLYKPTPGNVLRAKIGESIWATFAYSCLWLFTANLVLDKTWFYDTRTLFPAFDGVEAMDAGLRTVYMSQLGFYVGSAVLHVFIEEPRKDYYEMLLHHVVAMLLIGASFDYGYTKIGILVSFIHDSNDILLHVAKLSEYWAAPMAVQVFLFASLAASWIYCRLYLYNLKVLYAAAFVGPEVLKEHGQVIPYHPLFVACLSIISLLNIFWFYVLIKVAVRAITRGDLKDPLDHDFVDNGEKKTK